MKSTRRGFLGVLGAAAGWLATPARLRALSPPPAPAVLPVAVALENVYMTPWADYVAISDLAFMSPIDDEVKSAAKSLADPEGLISRYVPMPKPSDRIVTFYSYKIGDTN